MLRSRDRRRSSLYEEWTGGSAIGGAAKHGQQVGARDRDRVNTVSCGGLVLVHGERDGSLGLEMTGSSVAGCRRPTATEHWSRASTSPQRR